MSSELNSKVSFRTLPGLFSSASVRALWGWALKGLGLRVGNRVGLLLQFVYFGVGFEKDLGFEVNLSS